MDPKDKDADPNFGEELENTGTETPDPKAVDESEEIDPAALAAVADEVVEGEEVEPDEGRRTPAPVPYSRLSKVVDERNTLKEQKARLEGENEALRRQLSPAKPAEPAPEPVKAIDLKELGKQKAKALLDGDMDLYADLDVKGMQEVQRLSDEKSDKNAVARSHEAVSRSRQQQAEVEMQEVAAELEAKYPFLDQESDEADQDAIDDVVYFRNKAISKGVRATTALKNAVDKVARQREKESADPAAPRLAVVPNKGKERDAAALKRAATASQAQPQPLESGIGARSGASTIDTKNLTDQQIAKIGNTKEERLKMFASDFGG